MVLEMSYVCKNEGTHRFGSLGACGLLCVSAEVGVVGVVDT